MEWLLRGEFHVTGVPSVDEGLRHVQKQNHLVALLRLKDDFGAGFRQAVTRFVSQLKDLGNSIRLVAYTPDTELKFASELIGNGIYDLILQPIDVAHLRSAVWRATCDSWFAGKQMVVGPVPPRVEEILGISDKVREINASIHKLAPVDLPLLITGESGTGKEIAARAIHDRSLRKHGPFVTINCSAIPETLLESELFGYEKGAFTGALRQKKGKIEYAQGGTLFLDEIGELPLALQAKLLRFLEDRAVARIGGGTSDIQVNARIIAATNKNLKNAVLQSAFRADLYYRLAIGIIDLPPLRERGEDSLLMAKAFCIRATEEYRINVYGFSDDAIEAIREYPWPGNIRELLNKIRRAVVMAEGSYITAKELELPSRGPCATEKRLSLKEAQDRVGQKLLIEAILRHSGNVKHVAAELQVSRPTVYYLLDHYQIRTLNRFR